MIELSPLVGASDATVVATAAISATAALGAAFLAYLGGARQERKRVREGQTEAARQARGQIYVDFLNTERELETMTALSRRIDKDRFEEWAKVYTERHNSALLLGTEAVRTAVLNFHPIQLDMFQALRDKAGDIDPTAFDAEVRGAERQSREDRREAREKLIAAMREDVASVTGTPVIPR